MFDEDKETLITRFGLRSMVKEGKTKAEGRGGVKQKSSLCAAVMTAIYNTYMFILPTYTSRRWEKMEGRFTLNN